VLESKDYAKKNPENFTHFFADYVRIMCTVFADFCLFNYLKEIVRFYYYWFLAAHGK